MEFLQQKNANNFSNLKSYYPELMEKYPFLKSYIKNNKTNENNIEESSPNVEINPFKKRCLLSLLLKTEIQNEQTPQNKNIEMEL